jgi:hypothetical protein
LHGSKNSPGFAALPAGTIPFRCLSELTAENIEIARLCAKYASGTSARLLLVAWTSKTADQLSLIYGKRAPTRNDAETPAREARGRLLGTLNKYRVPYPQSLAIDLSHTGAQSAGDDIDAELREAVDQVKTIRATGAISDEEYAALDAEGTADKKTARAHGDAARAAARALHRDHYRNEIREALRDNLDDETIETIAREVEERAWTKRPPDA